VPSERCRILWEVTKRLRRRSERGRISMLFMVVERFKPGRVSEVYARFRERGRMLPGELEYVSSWVDVERTCCFQLMETGDHGLLDKWMENWKDLIDFEVFPVISSAEMQRVMTEM